MDRLLLSVFMYLQSYQAASNGCPAANVSRPLNCPVPADCPGDECGLRDAANIYSGALEYRCACDPLCELYGDCCAGLQHCQPDLPSDVKEAAMNLVCANPSKLLKGVNELGKTNYLEIRTPHASVYGVFLRSSCSQTWPRDRNSQLVREKCEMADMSVNISNALSVTPVSTPDITYGNVYCAICNNHNVSEYVYWKPGLYCDDGTHGDPLNGNVTLQSAEQSCSIAYFEQPSVTPRQLDPLRPCIANIFVDTCLPYDQLQNKSADLSKNEYDCAAARCRSYADYLYNTGGEKQFFKNIDCALCNGISVTSLSCVGIRVTAGGCFACTSFTALLDFGDSGEISFQAVGKSSIVVTDSCAAGQVYNPGRMQCQDLVCPPNFVLAGDVCMPSKPETILLTLSLILFTNATIEKLQDITSEENIDSFQTELLGALYPLLINGTVRQLNVSVTNTTLDIRLEIDVANDNYTIDRILSSISNFSVRFHYSDVLFLSSPVDVQIPTAYPNLVCALIALNESEYQLFENHTLFLAASSKLLQQSEYIITNGMAFYCNEFNQTFNRTVTVAKTWNYNTASIILSVIGSGVLLFACVSLFITYSLFRELRTLPGQCIMSYALSIAIGQIFFIFGPGLTDNGNVCTAMGVCLHYFTLCQFTWSSVLATDLAKTFVLTRRIRSSQKDSQAGTFAGYNLYAWGVPLIICLIAVILDQSTDIDIDYASDRICWLQPKIALLVAFVVPATTILAYNLVAFIALSISMYGAAKMGAMARSEMAERGKTLSMVKRHLKIFVGTFSLLGLTWIAAFLAAIEQLDWLWYVFVCATVLQGIVLFVVFVLNQKVRHSYAKLYKKKSQKQPSDGELRPRNLWMTKTSSTQQTPLGTPSGSMDTLNDTGV